MYYTCMLLYNGILPTVFEGFAIAIYPIYK